MKTEILCKKIIKPSIPTPHQRQKLNISFIDQLAPSVYPPTIFYYPALNGSQGRAGAAERCNRLERSLSDTLTLFYPMAGRFIKDKLLVDCSDQGAEYLEAQVVDAQLAQILDTKDKVELLDHFVPFVIESDTSPLLVIQVNKFDCGGLAIGVRISHRIADGFTYTTFVNGWATAARAGVDQVSKPYFGAASFLPARDLSWVMPRPVKGGANKTITKRFVFDPTAILKLKAKTNGGAMASGLGDQLEATRVEVVMALIWRALIHVSRAKHGHSKVSILSQPMKLRGKLFSSIPENCCGNLYRQCNAKFMADESKMELHDLVYLLRDAKRKAMAEGDDGGHMRVINSFKELHQQLNNEKVDVVSLASLCRFPLYDADFGWGKPSWVSRTSIPAEVIILMDTKYGDGIEVWASLKGENMFQFQQDPDIVAHVSGPLVCKI